MTGRSTASVQSRGGPLKKPRKSISLDIKLGILNTFYEDMCLLDIAKHFNLASSIVATIKKDEDKILQSAKCATPVSAITATRHQLSVMEDTERLLS